MTKCPDCGAAYASAQENCATRFDALLALDHSRTEPWGSRHSLAFSTFALQHPGRFTREVLQRSWFLLVSVYEKGVSADRVAGALRRFGKRSPDWDLAPLPPGNPAASFRVTIADLGAFAAESYPAQLDDWCRATLEAWRALARS